MVLPQDLMKTVDAVVAGLLRPLHWVIDILAMSLAVFLAGALILIEQKAARSRHTVG